MARVRKAQVTLESICFSTPEQKVLRLLLSEPTTAFTPRVISSKLKGVRGLGGSEGIQKILDDLSELGLVDFVDNQRSVRLHDDTTVAHILKTFSAICDLESLQKLLLPLSTRAILYGSRATGASQSDSDYDLLIVTNRGAEVKEIAAGHPLGKMIRVHAVTSDEYAALDRAEPALAKKVAAGIVLWSSGAW